MEQESRMHKFLMSLPFWWILLTAIYIALLFLGWGYVAGTIGLFVPVGIWNFVFSFGTEDGRHPWIIVFPLVLLTIFGGEWLIRKLNLSAPSFFKIFLILILLFFLTIAVDLIIWGNWQSFKFLRWGGDINCC